MHHVRPSAVLVRSAALPLPVGDAGVELERVEPAIEPWEFVARVVARGSRLELTGDGSFEGRHGDLHRGEVGRLRGGCRP